MRIEHLFQKDIFRPINGVVKADQMDEASVWQELDELVVTRELDQHFNKFFSQYCEALGDGNNPEVADRIGVWVSGFFGSGKSHFIKVLSYLLRNETHTHEGVRRRAVDFFESKISDAMLFGDIQRAGASGTDVILFNIDSKADSRAGRDAILSVFLKVLNELQGFSGDHAHIAHMERYLQGKAKLRAFHDAYRELTGTEWIAERDAYELNRDQVALALSRALGQSVASCEKWIDGAEDNFSLTVESFARRVREYLDSRGPGHRLIFLVDEVGQFIGGDTSLMLNLQTIVEELGVLCRGRAWVVVTSQEDIDAVLGELRSSNKANDFSKIQGRFKTRLSLSSANVDEVIQERLLAKRPEAKPILEKLYAQKGDVIQHQLTFKNVGMTFKKIRDAEDFARNYPFVPYQFKLLQKIFESIRKAGATGLHLAQGERSLLDAFQSAAKAVSGQPIGVAVPLYLFYPSIESFLDTGVKRTIDHARENGALEPFDAHVLEVLFLIRYVDEMKGNLENLVTLCLDQVDADRLDLRHKIEKSLRRLESETLISRSGDNYFFLTNEERDVNREIKSVELSSSEEAKLLGELIFGEVLKDQKKHRYAANKMDFGFNRLCDLHPVGSRVEGALVVSVVTPLNDDYEAYQDAKCVLASAEEEGRVLIRLSDDESLGRELRTLLKTDKYLRTKDDGTLQPSTRKIHRDLADDNRARRARLVHLLSSLLAEARIYAAGQKLDISTANPSADLDQALSYLIDNTFTKMRFLATLTEKPLAEIQAVLRSGDLSQGTLDVGLPQVNAQAIEDLRRTIDLCTKTSRPIVLHELINDRYGNRPYGWPPLEVVLLLARLHVAGEIRFMLGGAAIERAAVHDAITTPGKWRKILVIQRASTDPEAVRKARQLGKDVYSEMGPEGEEALHAFLRGKSEAWRSRLAQYKTLSDTGNYPGRQEITEGLAVLRSLLALEDSKKFFERMLERKADLLDLSEHFHDLEHFYEHQVPSWERLRAAVRRFEPNQHELGQDEKAARALARMNEILAAAHPYGLLHEVDGLIRTVDGVNEALLAGRRASALEAIDRMIEAVTAEILEAGALEAVGKSMLQPLQQLRGRIGAQQSLAHISQAEAEALQLKDQAIAGLEKHLTEQAARAAKAGQKVAAQPKVKPRRIIEPGKLVTKPYLETQSDVDAYLSALRRLMEEALARNERIEIR
jgi:hypothetical protein